MKYLSSFGEADNLCDADIWLTEEYLVKVWAGVKSNINCRTFSKLRLHEYTSTKNAKSLDTLPPTSSSILGHIWRAYSVIRDVLSLLDNDFVRTDPTSYKWYRESGILLPDMCHNPLPEDKTVSCKCVGKCMTKKCACR